MNIKPVRTRVLKENDSLGTFIRTHIQKIPEKSILVIASKIVALSEGRVVRNPELAQKEKLIQKESARAIKTKYAWLTIKDGMVMANAGIDESNANGKLLLLPKDSYASAKRLRKELKKIYKIKNVGVIISDSHIAPLRAGVVAHALGYAGIKGIRDYRGTKDMFGKKMTISRTNVADSLATAAALAMGEGAEQQPLALITDAPVVFVEKINKKETVIAPKDDMYWPLLKAIRRKD